MPDTTVTNLDPKADDLIRYALGRSNWINPFVPDLQNKGGTVALNDQEIIDVLILGDGFTGRTDFETAIQTWITQFFLLDVYTRFAGAFRIRALFTKSDQLASVNRKSFYRTALDNDGQINLGGWVGSSGTDNQWFRDKVVASAGHFTFNQNVYPSNLVGTQNIHNDLAGMFSNFVLVMLVNTASGQPSGGTRSFQFDAGHSVNIGLGAYSVHEFGHAFAYLQDEYISERGTSAEASNPSSKSIYNLSNLSYSDRINNIPWFHISPWGLVPRQAAGIEPSPLVGWLWRGGESDNNVWHSEYNCLMNGTHKNYTWKWKDDDPVGTLRTKDRFCLWCQEIVVIRILEKTGQLAKVSNTTDVNNRGKQWMNDWENHWRPLYESFFGLQGEITAREIAYTPGNIVINTEGTDRILWQSDLYQPFAYVPADAGSAPDLTDEEIFLLGTI
jgi:IgA Peptidase M64